MSTTLRKTTTIQENTIGVTRGDKGYAPVPAPPMPMKGEEYKIRHDNLSSTPRAGLYDTLARDLHYPSYRRDFTVHYNELARSNRKFHDLNYPCPQPSNRGFDETYNDDYKNYHKSTMSKSRSRSRSRSKSKSMSSYLEKQEPKSLKNLLIQKIKLGNAPDQQKIIDAVYRSLLNKGLDHTVIEDALRNAAVRYVVNEESSKIEICLFL